ncbi:AraC family transcriptional regulator [Persicitalea jodogahamensis]|uniref:AraC family transcriptional regulator n=2 Tax=Persicitalea jodogahamensis TaxID=402147 RepID=A0A8J3D2U2_9BACT|nr:AraC family transcriptional regulator [Persicitalea jodogahamensis]
MAKLSTHLPVKDKIELGKSIKIAPFRKHVRKTAPHKHNKYLEIIYLSGGSGFHSIDSFEYPINPPLIHIVRQEQVHYWQLESEPEGFVVILKRDFVEKSLDKELKSLIEKISRQPGFRVDNHESLEKFFKLLVEENSIEEEYSFPVVEGLLKALLAKILRVSIPLTPSTADDSVGLFKSFLHLLEEDNGLKRKVSYYADLLAVSPQNLNAVSRTSASKSASGVIAEFVMAESKRLLLYTDKTVSEIAFSLEFSDSSHFVKHFKKTTGTTPQLFRTANR